MRDRSSVLPRNCIAAAMIGLSAAALPALAQQDYPNRTIHMITPSTPGGTSDILARLVGARLTEVFNKQVIVENRPSAGGVIASEMVAKARPDGYTLYSTFTQHTVTPALKSNLPYHPVNDFTPITQLTAAGLILVVNSSTPANNLKEFVALTKRYEKGALNYGNAGPGSGSHLSAELYNLMTGIKAVSVPYKGTYPVLVALMTGEIHYSFAGMQAAQPLINQGKLRAIAVTTPKRIPSLPDLPAVAETLPGFQVVGWYGVMGPARLPQPIVTRLHDEIVKFIQQPDTRKRIEADGSEVVGSSPEEFRKFLLGEFERAGKLIKDSGIRVE